MMTSSRDCRGGQSEAGATKPAPGSVLGGLAQNTKGGSQNGGRWLAGEVDGDVVAGGGEGKFVIIHVHLDRADVLPAEGRLDRDLGFAVAREGGVPVLAADRQGGVDASLDQISLDRAFQGTGELQTLSLGGTQDEGGGAVELAEVDVRG